MTGGRETGERKLPTRTRAMSIGDRGMALAELRFAELDWIFRRQDGQSDFGVDAEIELVESGQVTGRLVKCQVKGSEALEWDANSGYGLAVKVSTFNLWQRLGLPFVALLADVTSDRLYWTLPLAQSPSPGPASITLRFARDREISRSGAGLAPLLSYLRGWFEAHEDHVLRAVPVLYRIYVELRDMFDGDPWVPVDTEIEDKMVLFYRHLLQLRAHLGLSNDSLPTLDDWYARNEAAWDSPGDLYHGTLREMRAFVPRFYEEALAGLRQRLSLGPTADMGLENFLHDPDGTSGERVYWTDSRAGDPEFHRLMEVKLQAADARMMQVRRKLV